jgi:DNA-binding phage protein
MKIFEIKDIVFLLRDEVRRAGGQEAFSRKTGVDRTSLNKVLNGSRPPSPLMIDALGLRPIFVRKNEAP